jgi:hypothetical protein
VKIMGVDPGGRGALALLSPIGLEVQDMPVFEIPRGKGFRRELDVHRLVDLLNYWAPDVCWFEQVGGMEGDSAASAFSFGHITGACEALVKAQGSRFERVAPHVWKKAMKLRGGPVGKDQSRARATDLFPANAADFRRKQDDGRAEAALLAEYGRVVATQGVFA